MRALSQLFRRVALGVAYGAAGGAILGFLGFASPYLDIFNHFQLLLFLTLVAALAATQLLTRAGVARNLFVAVVATGFVASAAIFVPEAISGLALRPALPIDGRPVLTVMTHNIFGMNYDMVGFDRYVASVDPDIVALQEFFPEQREELTPLLSARYPFQVICEGGKRANIGLFSKLPFAQTVDGACAKELADGERTAHIIAHFSLENGAAFTLVTTHLDWPVPVQRQRDEYATLASVLNGIDGPLLLMGDFNSTPWSYAQRGFVAATGLTRQTRNLPTFPALWWYANDWRPALPVLPLDQVMTRNGITVHSLATGAMTGSDHLPVVFTFSVGE
ncbi:MAG: hypothetical protein JWR75_1119 [Devosia sp.]|nr:hypothetical protein [Devosia sp.]